MIARIEGVLEALEDDRAHVTIGGGVTLEVLVPAFTGARLGGLLDQPVVLHTLLFLEAQAQGTTINPRLAGFLSPDDRAFYRLFITCKGIGPRRALRAMTLSTSQIAAAIADRDLATLQSLPEVGRRTAETIATTLHDKVDRFIAAEAYGGDGRTPGAARTGKGPNIAREALEVLLQLGENRGQAIAWIDEALAQSDPPRDVQDLINEVYRLKAGA